ncbi:MAG: family 78 glycoside hydrolase catalytic domain, partial [Gammaproteobacteria bacterium]|nr:family 78 glycoside hydrolase catalytic domain [Gammaproteobacteria bacterium]NIR93350.1 family 78 glycoside hydrolase catalytic domain [Gammaproteobacteria bacterium]NIX56117.1 family 78 glycoside hydrolase catalytic domain [candidate division Zixibacteria bacterium]
MDAQVMPAIKVRQTIQPVAETQPEEGVYLFDMGQNFPGWWRIRTEGDTGVRLRVKAAETLNDSLFPTPLQPG